MDPNNGIPLENPELQLLRLNKQDGYNYRFRRTEDWVENYTLYRDRVIVNRLTQRQSVNLPLMKETIRTLLKDVDDLPVVEYENLDNDKQAEVFENEYWKLTLDQNKADIKDIVDKRQMMLYGRTFDQWQIINGKVHWDILDPEDILISRYMDPAVIDSSRFLIHLHIFRPLASLEREKDYDQEAISRLKLFFANAQGLIKATNNEQLLIEKNRKMAALGVLDIDHPVLGETYVELTMHFVYHKEAEDEEEQIYLYVEAEDMEILLKKPLEEIIGVTEDHYWRTHYPYNTWADDIDNQDFWSDGVADIVRVPNKVMNAWFSQMVENRTLRNLNMQVYDATVEGFTPQTFSPQAWGWYGVPGKPGEVYQQMQVADLGDSLEEMNFVTEMIEKATGATSTQQGVQSERNITLGEVQLALGQAKERIKGMSKFYTQAWKERAEKFQKLIEAAPDKIDAVKIYKKGRNTDNIYSREVSPADWKTKSGSRVKIWSQDERDSENTQKLQRLNAAVANMPDNPILLDIYRRNLLEFGDLTPDQVNGVMEFEKQKQEAMLSGGMGGGMPGQAPGAPGMGGGMPPQQSFAPPQNNTKQVAPVAAQPGQVPTQ